MKKNILFVTGLLLGTILLGGCSKDTPQSENPSQNNTNYHNDSGSTNQNYGTRDVLNDADHIGYVTEFSNEGFILNLMKTEKAEDGGELAIVGSGDGNNSGTGNLNVRYDSQVVVKTIIINTSSSTYSVSDEGSKEDILKDTQVAIHGTLEDRTFIANEVYIIRYAG